jgi:Flp pilus assembly protein TadD
MLASVLLSILLLNPMSGDDLQNVNPIEMSPEMKAFVDNHVNRGISPSDRLHALTAAIFQGNDLHFSFFPESRTAGETFRHRSGNCLSFTLLFISMARYLNLDAQFHEVEIPPTFNKKGNFVVLNQHINSIVFIGPTAYSVDVFPEAASMETLGRIVSDQRGFAYFFANKGADELSKGNLALADQFLKIAIEIDPSTISALINLGVVQAQAERFDEAAYYYNRALKLDKKNMAALTNLANVYEKTGRTAEFLLLQQKVKKYQDLNPYYHFDLGLQSYAQGDYETALSHYEKAIKLKSADPSFYLAEAHLYEKTGQKEKAVAKMRLAEKKSNDPNKKLLYAQKLEFLKTQ